MHAWWPVPVPSLRTSSVAPTVYDSASLDFVTLPTDKAVSLYVCGITPYDATHMGHAATYVAFDTLVRTWAASGATVRYTQNVTDIDDPLIERALATNRKWEDIALEQTELFREDMRALRVIPPMSYIGAVESIPLVVDRIKELDAHNTVYNLDGDLYYDISQTNMLGAVAHMSRDEMIDTFRERGGDPDRAGKRDPLDALLWRHQRPNDPSWPTELGAGRPGWHIECAAIAMEYLGASIDVQGGGSDLKFPHHEMSAAHAQSASGVTPFASVFMHTGMVGLDGKKMSKSLGNLVFVSKLRQQGVDPMAIRLTILSNHYRSDWEWFDSNLTKGIERLAQWRSALSQPSGVADISVDIAAALADDLNTPKALRLVDAWVAASLAQPTDDDVSSKSMARTIDALLGIV